MSLIYDTEQQLLPLAQNKASAPEFRLRRRQRAYIVLGLAAVDIVSLLLTFGLVYLLRFKVFGFLYVPEGSVLRFYSELVYWVIPGWLTIFSGYRLYDLRVLHGGISEYRRLASACTISMIMLLALSFFMDDHLIISRAWLLMVWFTSIVLTGGGRFLVRRVLYRLRQSGIAMTRVLIVGANYEACQVGQQLSGGKHLPGMEIVGFIGERRTANRSNETKRNKKPLVYPGRWLGQIGDVREVVDNHHIDEVVIASTALRDAEMMDVIRKLTTSNVEIRLSPSMYEMLTTGLEVQEINGLPLVSVSKVRITGVNALLKRSLDIIVSAGILLVFSPLWLSIAIKVKLDSPGPVIYRRRVVGQGGKPFDAFKFRSMRGDGDKILAERPDLQEELQRTGKLKDDPRITKLGKFIRKTSLDEIPQLFNVLLGQMSLVGPRMITYQEMIKFGKWQTNLMTVKPGMTGLWQVSGRSNLSYEDRVRLDMHYIRNYSIWMDLRILFQTVPAVLKGSGAY
jgi:exopolysaccharide biosynthesis polyprenyl glycosylphosphotransferase